jgi:hypothetical protein
MAGRANLLVSVSAVLLLCWTNLAGGRIISPFPCSSNWDQLDTTPWVSVTRGAGWYSGHVYQYWLTQAYVYGIDAEYTPLPQLHSSPGFTLLFSSCAPNNRADWLAMALWQLPDKAQVNGLTLTYYNNAPNDQVLRMLLLNTSNCLLECNVTSVLPGNPPNYTLGNTYCFAGLPLWQKIVPDNNANMADAKYIYLVSLTHIAVISAETIQPVSVIKVRCLPGLVHTRCRAHSSSTTPPATFRQHTSDRCGGCGLQAQRERRSAVHHPWQQPAWPTLRVPLLPCQQAAGCAHAQIVISMFLTRGLHMPGVVAHLRPHDLPPRSIGQPVHQRQCQRVVLDAGGGQRE